jgi:hypothetical protein
MAKTVAEIDGDSSGLVGSLDKAKAALGDLGTKGKKSIDDLDKAGKKLSDQLKSVADDADVAAGNLVSKLGGPGAIKAIAGVGLAFEGASRLAGAFLDSSEALFKSYGDEGQKVWDNAEKSLFAVKGAFAEAVLGGGSMEDMGARLTGIFDTMKTAVDVLLIPIKALSVLIVAVGENARETSGYVVEASDKLNQLADNTKITGLAKVAEGIEGLRLKLLSLRGATEEVRQAELARDIAKAEAYKLDILATEGQADALNAAAAVVAAQPQIAKKAEEARLKYLRDLGEEKLSHADLAAARSVYNNEMLAQGQLVMAQQMKQREGVSKATQDQLDSTNAIIAGFKEVAATPPPAKTNTGGGGGGGGKEKPETEAEQGARLIAAAQAAVDAAIAEQDAIKSLREKNDKDEQQLELDKMKWTIDQSQVKYDAIMDQQKRAKDFEQKLEDEYAAAKHAAGELTEAEEEERNAARLKAVQDLAGAELGTYMQSAGKQLAIGKLSAKAAADMARSQLGNVIIGQGDKAMAEAGIMAAALNPLAVPMAAAGLAAYAIGNAMMPTAKPTAGSTPATEKPADSGQASTNNYAFNMRVDSVFADGESVARQFAMMQESARARGLLMQGA